MDQKISVGVLGATGNVGQRLVEMLSNHPWFELCAVAASERSSGKTYGEAVRWHSSAPIPSQAAALPMRECYPTLPCRLVFSALDSTIAGHIEEQFARAGYLVVTNATNHRMRSDVPLIIPEININHLSLLKQQPYAQGKIIANPNCSAIGLSLVLKPLHDAFGITQVHVVTMQAISGAGYPGVASLDIVDNIIPYIEGEEGKLETETLKIFGKCKEGIIFAAPFKISAQCNRVAVTDGHTACISVKFIKRPSKEQIIAAWRGFNGLDLPTAPKKPIHYHESISAPQPKLHRRIEGGMAVSVGRLRECPLFDYKFVILSHNTIRGAAGGAILCAEASLKR